MFLIVEDLRGNDIQPSVTDDSTAVKTSRARVRDAPRSGFVECALPSVTTVFMKQPKQLHFQKCWKKTVHYEPYTQRAGHLDERAIFNIRPFHLGNLSAWSAGLVFYASFHANHNIYIMLVQL